MFSICTAAAIRRSHWSLFLLSETPSSLYSELLQFWTKICRETTLVVERRRLRHFHPEYGDASSDLQPPTPTQHTGWCVDRINICSKTHCSSTLRLLACTLSDGCPMLRCCHSPCQHSSAHTPTQLVPSLGSSLEVNLLSEATQSCGRWQRMLSPGFKPLCLNCSCWNYGCCWSCKKRKEKRPPLPPLSLLLCVCCTCVNSHLTLEDRLWKRIQMRG